MTRPKKPKITDVIVQNENIPLPPNTITSGAAYSTADGEVSLSGYSQGISAVAGDMRRSGSFKSHVGFYGSGGGPTNMRAPFTQEAYDAMRPHNALPDNHHDLMIEVETVYKEEGIIRNTIDLMTDFCCAGIKLNHPNKYHQKLFRNWFSRINGLDRSERFLNNLYKYGNVIVVRSWGTLTRKQRRDLNVSQAADQPLDIIETKKFRIPTKYTFLNPAYVRSIDGEKSLLSGKPIKYEIFVPTLFNSEYKIFDTIEPEDRDLEYTFDFSDNGTKPLDMTNTQIYHFKKEDWEIWATPIIYSVLRDVYQLQMNRIADFTALETAATPVRIWTLGDWEHKIVPNEAAFVKLREALTANPGAGMRDIVWGEDLKLQESSTHTNPIFGEEKYKPCLNAIYVGLGIPPTLTGSVIGGSGTTNNLISLKTLVKRLIYGRAKLLEFWNNEIEIFRKAMGIAKPAEIDFDDINLGDEEAEKKLWIELADRNLISDEWVQHKFGATPDIESSRLNREYKARQNFKRVPKGGPWNDPQLLQKLETKLVESERITPDQIGLTFPDPDPEEDNVEPLDDGTIAPTTNSTPSDSKKPAQKAGRPLNSKDTVQRKRKRFVPRTKAQIWGAAAQERIAEILNPTILAYYNKKNLRSLSEEEAENAEQIRFNVLMSLEPFTELTEENIKSGVSHFNEDATSVYKDEINEISSSLGRALTLNEKRTIQLEVFLNGYF